MQAKATMANFVNAINCYGLRDIGFIGPRFTWLYERRDGIQIREHLDKALATTEWVTLFPTGKIHHLTSSTLDLSPLMLRLVRKNKKKRIRVELGATV